MFRKIDLSTPIYSQNFWITPSNILIFLSLPLETGTLISELDLELMEAIGLPLELSFLAPLAEYRSLLRTVSEGRTVPSLLVEML